MQIGENLSNPTDRRQEEYQLVCQARELNDQRAYATLLRSYWDNVHLLLLRIVHNESVAEDLTMVSFSRAFESLETFTPKSSFGTWVFRIATNAGIDYLRHKRLPQVYLDDLGYDSTESREYPMPSREANPEEAIIHQQRLKMLSKAVKQLDPSYRDLVELRYFEEYSYEEIAEVLQIPVSTVRIRLHRAKNYLRALFVAVERKGDISD